MTVKKQWPDKDPDERLDYYFDWSPRMLEGDNIIEKEATVITGTVIIEQNNVYMETLTTQHWISGGTLGETCEILLHIKTSYGRELDQTCYMRIKKR